MHKALKYIYNIIYIDNIKKIIYNVFNSTTKKNLVVLFFLVVIIERGSTMETFLTEMAKVVTSVATQFGTIGAQIINNEIIQLAVGMAVFTYLFNKSLKLVRQIRRA